MKISSWYVVTTCITNTHLSSKIPSINNILCCFYSFTKTLDVIDEKLNRQLPNKKLIIFNI